MEELRGMPVVKALAQQFETDIRELASVSVVPKLAMVRIGEREDDLSYERGAKKRFEAVGALTETVVLSEEEASEKLFETVEQLVYDASVHGILLFRPLPKNIDERALYHLLGQEKDVDCMTPENYAHLFMADKKGHLPCTPQAVLELIDYYNIALKGKKVTIVGRSLVVGKPLAVLLTDRNATVTLCHTKTEHLEEECRAADILIAAAGVPKMIGASFVKAGQIVIDVGINVVDGKLCGDVDSEAVSEIVAALTPVPGGIGTITNSVLLKHTIESAKKQLHSH